LGRVSTSIKDYVLARGKRNRIDLTSQSGCTVIRVHSYLAKIMAKPGFHKYSRAGI
jgi:hypothetical protein